MTIASTTNKNDYTGNGAVDTYAYSFRIITESDLVVTVADLSDVETILTLTTDYTITGVGDSGGGNVVLVDASQAWLDGDGDLLTDFKINIRRVRPLTQTTDIRNQGSFLPETHEDVFDHQIMVAQQLQEQIDRAVVASPTQSTVTLEALAVSVAAASASETNAATSETNAATSATNASTSETNAATSETNAAASAASIDATKIISGDTEVSTNVTNNTVEVTAAGTKEAQVDANGLTLKSGASVNEFSVDTTMGGNSDDAVPTEKAVKAHTLTLLIDEDDMASDSTIKAPTQQSVKAFVEALPASIELIGVQQFTTSGTKTISHSLVDGVTYKLILSFNNTAANEWSIRVDADANAVYDSGMIGRDTVDYAAASDVLNRLDNATSFGMSGENSLVSNNAVIGAELLLTRQGNNVHINGWINGHIHSVSDGINVMYGGTHGGADAPDSVELILAGNATGNMYLYKLATS